MRVLMCNSYYYIRGGAERCFFDLSALLTEHGHDVIPFSMHHPDNLPTDYAEYFVSNIDFPTMLAGAQGLRGRWRVASRVIYSREARAQIERMIEDTRPDIAHVHGIAHELSPSILPALTAAGIPTVQTLHDYKLMCPNTTFVSHGEVCERCAKGRYFHATVRRCKRGSLPASFLATVESSVHHVSGIYSRNIDTFIAPSQFLATKVREHGIQTRVEHIPNFVNVDAIEPCYDKDDFVIFAGRLSAVKGVRTLVEAMRHVPTVKLLVAGTGDLGEELQRFVAEHDLGDRITFLGHLAAPDLFDLIRRARAMIVPSEWYENYPMSAIESLACGTPVIGAHIGGIPEIVLDRETGLLFTPGNIAELADAIRILIDDPGLVKTLGRRGRQRVEEINHPKRHYEDTIQLYSSLQ